MTGREQFMVVMYRVPERRWSDTGGRWGSFHEAEVAAAKMHSIVQNGSTKDRGTRFKATSLQQWRDQ